MDKEFLYELIEEFEKRNIQELTFENEEGAIHLLKPASSGHAVPPVVPPSPPELAMPTAAGPVVNSGHDIVKAPIVGNFYRQPAPDAPYFTNEGDQVKKGQTLCILEAMKLMNELEAEFDCEIVKVLVENGTMVEFDTPLFEVKRV